MPDRRAADARAVVHAAIFDWADDPEFEDVNIEHGCLADVILGALSDAGYDVVKRVPESDGG
jgi:hypothetical protein